MKKVDAKLCYALGVKTASRKISFFALFIIILAFTFGCRTNENSENVAPVVFVDASGRSLKLDELEGLSGNFNYEILGTEEVSAEAIQLHKQARQAGEAGDTNQAISLLAQASQLSPLWPYPVYDMAFAYLLLGDAKNAQKYYEKTIKLSPRGFFTAITALHTLKREERGELPVGTYLAYLSLEWLTNPQEKSQMVQRFVSQIPSFAPGWLELAALSSTDPSILSAIDSGLSANPDPETKGLLLINRALLLERRGDHEGAVRVSGELALDPASTYGTEHMAKVTLAYLVQN